MTRAHKNHYTKIISTGESNLSDKSVQLFDHNYVTNRFKQFADQYKTHCGMRKPLGAEPHNYKKDRTNQESIATLSFWKSQKKTTCHPEGAFMCMACFRFTCVHLFSTEYVRIVGKPKFVGELKRIHAHTWAAPKTACDLTRKHARCISREDIVTSRMEAESRGEKYLLELFRSMRF